MIVAILTGTLAGLIHVWTGPDHLAAIAPLAVRRPERSWVPGARWGLGHSTGVAVVGLLSLLLRDLIPVEWLWSWGERLVGVMLSVIGIWALHQAFKSRLHVHEHEHDGNRHVHIHAHHHGHVPQESAPHRHTHVAFGIGTLHGLAGSSHFLGVLPALAFPTAAQSVAYIASFGAGTVAAMAVFSWGVGRMAGHLAGHGRGIYRGLMTACGAATLGVGMFWMATSFH